MEYKLSKVENRPYEEDLITQKTADCIINDITDYIMEKYHEDIILEEDEKKYIKKKEEIRFDVFNIIDTMNIVLDKENMKKHV